LLGEHFSPCQKTWFLFTDRGVVLAGKLDDSSKRLTAFRLPRKLTVSPKYVKFVPPIDRPQP
jgi:hypothetical protein